MLEKACDFGFACGTGARAKKYSTESWKPVKLPRGSTRPVAFWLKRPGGTPAAPCWRIGELVGVDGEVVDLREGPEVAPFIVVPPRIQRTCRGNQTGQNEAGNQRYEQRHGRYPT